MKDYILKQFETIFENSDQTNYFFSPGRVNMIGEHIDYNGGHVFPCALTLGTYGIARKRNDNKVLLYSVNLKEEGIKELSINNLTFQQSNSWANYPLGMIWALKENGYVLDSGFELLIYGTIPTGSGLSSSASIEVLVGTVIKHLYQFEKLNMVDIALISQQCENQFVGMNCGIMDQFAAAMGKKDHAILLNTGNLEYVYAPLTLTDEKIIITNSKVKHNLVDTKYNERRQECTDALNLLKSKIQINNLCDLNLDEFYELESVIDSEVLRKRARHAVSEDVRTMEAVKALKENDINKFGQLMNESHVSLRDDYEVSCDEIDLLTELAWNIDGVVGSRITGGGFGGCTVSIVKNHAIDIFKDTISKEYKNKTGFEPDFYIAEISNGAQLMVE